MSVSAMRKVAASGEYYRVASEEIIYVEQNPYYCPGGGPSYIVHGVEGFAVITEHHMNLDTLTKLTKEELLVSQNGRLLFEIVEGMKKIN